MGKRKTRKRSRSRKKTGGTFGIKSLCIWYGKGNVGTRGIFGKKARKPGEIKGGSECSSIDATPPAGATVLSIDSNKMVLNDHKDITELPNQLERIPLKTFKHMEPSLVVDAKYDIYVVRYEEECGSLGERYELYKIKEATIIKKPDSFVVSTSYWKDDMYFTENNDDKLDMQWGKTERVGTVSYTHLRAHET